MSKASERYNNIFQFAVTLNERLGYNTRLEVIHDDRASEPWVTAGNICLLATSGSFMQIDTKSGTVSFNVNRKVDSLLAVRVLDRDLDAMLDMATQVISYITAKDL